MSTLELAKQLFAKQTQEEIKAGVADIRSKNPNLSFAAAYDQLMREQPKLSVEATGPAMKTERDQEISDACQELMKANPGMMFATAYNLLMQKRPELFRDSSEAGNPSQRMEKEEKVREMQAAIHEEIDKIREKEPHLTFALAFNRLMKDKPELFDFEGLE